MLLRQTWEVSLFNNLSHRNHFSFSSWFEYIQMYSVHSKKIYVFAEKELIKDNIFKHFHYKAYFYPLSELNNLDQISFKEKTCHDRIFIVLASKNSDFEIGKNSLSYFFNEGYYIMDCKSRGGYVDWDFGFSEENFEKNGCYTWRVRSLFPGEAAMIKISFPRSVKTTNISFSLFAQKDNHYNIFFNDSRLSNIKIKKSDTTFNFNSFKTKHENVLKILNVGLIKHSFQIRNLQVKPYLNDLSNNESENMDYEFRKLVHSLGFYCVKSFVPDLLTNSIVEVFTLHSYSNSRFKVYSIKNLKPNTFRRFCMRNTTLNNIFNKNLNPIAKYYHKVSKFNSVLYHVYKSPVPIQSNYAGYLK